MDYTKEEPPRFTAKVDADYGERLWSFRLALEGDTVTILEPESIAGIEAQVGEDGVTLRYDGAEVYTGAVTASGLSPAEALPLMRKLWREGLVTDAQRHGDTLWLTFYVEEGTRLVTAFDAASFTPLTAELYREGSRVLSAEISDFSF
ncbi:MAG: hypothetical protein ACSW8F_01155 [bacterium]